MKKQTKPAKFQDKTKESEIEENEDLSSSEEKEGEFLDLENDYEFDEETPEEIVEEVTEPETKLVPVNTELSKEQKIKAIKRALENKTNILSRERAKVRDWRSQAKDRDEHATSDYNYKKSELEERLRKLEIRYTKRMERTKKYWHDYSDNHERTKIAKIEKDITVLTDELETLEKK